MSITSVQPNLQPNLQQNTISIAISTLDHSQNQIAVNPSTKSILNASINIARDSGLNGEFEVMLGTGQVFKVDHEDCIFKMVDFD